MSKRTKIWLIIGASLVILGLIMFGAVMTIYNWDFTKLNTVEYETNTYELSEEFSNISMKTDTADILLVPSDDGICKVVCYEQENAKHSVAVKDGTLAIEVINTRKWYEYIGINFSSPKITVYIPRGEYGMLSVKASTGDVEIPEDFKFKGIDISVSTGDVENLASASELIKIKTSTGDICAQNISAGALDLSVSTGGVEASSIRCEGEIIINVSTGDTKLTDVACKSVTTTGNTGAITLKSVIATEKFTIKRSTGTVRFEDSDAAEIYVKTSTGDVKGSLLSEKIFIAEASTGDVSVPKSVTGGKCEIKTGTGDIKVEINIR